MSNLRSAREAIKAEIAHVTQGRDHYQMQLDMLQNALAALERVSPANPEQTTQRPRPASEKTARRSQGSTTAGSTVIPSTGGGFWIDLITDHPQSAPEILTAAIARLGMTPNKELIAKLSARMTNALNHLVKSQQIKDSGMRRERRFFR